MRRLPKDIAILEQMMQYGSVHSLEQIPIEEMNQEEHEQQRDDLQKLKQRRFL